MSHNVPTPIPGLASLHCYHQFPQLPSHHPTPLPTHGRHFLSLFSLRHHGLDDTTQGLGNWGPAIAPFLWTLSLPQLIIFVYWMHVMFLLWLDLIQWTQGLTALGLPLVVLEESYGFWDWTQECVLTRGGECRGREHCDHGTRKWSPWRRMGCWQKVKWDTWCTISKTIINHCD